MTKRKIILFLAVLLVAFTVLFLRKTDTLTNPQFWAEDGKVWYSDAYNLGGGYSIFLVQDGYFQTLPRLVAAASLTVPLSQAPLVFNLAALLIQILPVLILFSERFKTIIFDIRLKILIAGLYLLLPNSAEIHGNLTNAQWYLALTALMIILMPPAKKLGGVLFDYLILLLSGLSGPFCIFLSPVAFLSWLRDKGRQRFFRFLLLLACSLIQLYGLLSISSILRTSTAVGFSLKAALKIFGAEVIIGPLFGYHGNLWILGNFTSLKIYYLAAAVGIAILAFGLWKASYHLKLFIVFAMLILFSSFAAATKELYNTPTFERLVEVMDGTRYWLFPMLAFMLALVWGAAQGRFKLFRILATIILSLSAIGIYADFKHKSFQDLQFAAKARAFEKLPARSLQVFPLNPKGWEMELIKR